MIKKKRKWEIKFNTHKKIINKIKKDKKGCWNWLGKLNSGGYGLLGWNRKVIRAHRYFYEYYKGKIPKGLQIDHLCRNRGCVNPNHLEAVTCQTNVLRGKICQNRKPYWERVFLIREYIINKKSTAEIAKLSKITAQGIRYQMRKNNIKRRSNSESQLLRLVFLNRGKNGQFLKKRLT